MYNPVSSLVYAASGADVDTTIIDGNIIMRDRKISTINESKILEMAHKRGMMVTKKANVETSSKWPLY